MGRYLDHVGKHRSGRHAPVPRANNRHRRVRRNRCRYTHGDRSDLSDAGHGDGRGGDQAIRPLKGARRGNKDSAHHIDGGVLIEIAHHQFAIGLFQFHAIQPQLPVFGMCIPRSGLGLTKADHRSLDHVQQVPRASGVLMRDLDALTGEDVLNRRHAVRSVEGKVRRQKSVTM